MQNITNHIKRYKKKKFHETCRYLQRLWIDEGKRLLANLVLDYRDKISVECIWKTNEPTNRIHPGCRTSERYMAHHRDTNYVFAPRLSCSSPGYLWIERLVRPFEIGQARLIDSGVPSRLLDVIRNDSHEFQRGCEETHKERNGMLVETDYWKNVVRF